MFKVDLMRRCSEDVTGSRLEDTGCHIEIQYACFSINVKQQWINITKKNISFFSPMEVYMTRNIDAIITIDGTEA